MELLNKSGVPMKQAGDGLSHQDINAINSTANSAVEAINEQVLVNFCNVNSEINDYTKSFSLMEAIEVVPVSRRRPGIKVKFLNREGNYSEYTFSGKSAVVNETDWKDLNLWSYSFNSIDGGEW